MFAIFGLRMGPDEIVIVDAFPLSTELAGTSVQATVGGVTVDCFMVFTLAGQVAAILPSDTPVGDGTITLTYNPGFPFWPWHGHRIHPRCAEYHVFSR